MRRPTGSKSGVATGLDNPESTAGGRGKKRNARSKQASRQAATYRQMERVINEHNQRQRSRQDLNSLTNNDNNRDNTNTNNNNGSRNNSNRNNSNHNKSSNNIMGLIRGKEDAWQWMAYRRLGIDQPHTFTHYINDVVRGWSIPDAPLDPCILQQEEEDLQRTLKHYYVPRLGNMENQREEGVFRIMGGQLNSIGRKDVRLVKVQEIMRIVEDWDVQVDASAK